ncbi:MAG: hypothetical protein AAGI10_10250 [Pseudomonadota bacterium]
MRRFLALFALLLPGPLAAQEKTYDLPQGCEAFVTIQYKLCLVSHHYRCAGDAEGIQHRVDIDDEGPLFISTVNDQAEWVSSLDIRLDILDRLDPDPEDPANFTELARTGRDDFDFSTTSEVGERITYRGRDRLTGETIVIDDVPLLRTENFVRALAADGSVIWESTGNEYIHLDWRVFIRGQSLTRTPENTFQSDDEPLDFIFPGEDGFLTAEPEYNCNALLL